MLGVGCVVADSKTNKRYSGGRFLLDVGCGVVTDSKIQQEPDNVESITAHPTSNKNLPPWNLQCYIQIQQKLSTTGIL